MSSEVCTICGSVSNYRSTVGPVLVDDVFFGEIRVPGVAHNACHNCANHVSILPDGALQVRKYLDDLANKIVGSLPIKYFLSVREAKVALGTTPQYINTLLGVRKLISYTMNDGSLYIYKPSVDLYASTGNGAMNILDEYERVRKDHRA